MLKLHLWLAFYSSRNKTPSLIAKVSNQVQCLNISRLCGQFEKLLIIGLGHGHGQDHTRADTLYRTIGFLAITSA